MRKFCLIVVLLSVCFCNYITAQERVDTIYYDKAWKGVPNRTFADFYRVAIYPSNDNYKKMFRDFYITGELQATGEFISIDKYDDSKSVFDGESVIYFKSGKPQWKRFFKGGKLDGEYCEYFENGLLKIKTNYLNGNLNGLFTEFFENGTFMQAEYLNGNPKYNYYVMSNANGQVAKFRLSDHQPIWESPAMAERKIQYFDGIPWQYYVKNGLEISQTCTRINDYGRWYRVDIQVSNSSIIPIEFDPIGDIKAYSIDKKGVKRELTVWSNEQYMKKVKRSQAWAAVAVGLSEGLSTANAGYSTTTTNTNSHYNGSSSSYGTASAHGSGGYAYGTYSGNSTYSGSAYSTSTTTSYDATAAYQQRVLSQQRMADFSDALLKERNAKQMGYLKKNTISPGESIQGYVHLQRQPGQSVYISINVKGANYDFSWNFAN